ncbi:MAG: hypothetical protein PHI68_02255 [Candidatus Cloacimonetes bacterium]|jgi:hypothetical protein|nr:hypothetical protein [Candidatus Cloacimonadota bacterium]
MNRDYLWISLLAIFIFTLLSTSSPLSAQSEYEDYEFLKRYTLPDTAIAFSALVQQEGEVYRDSELFSGLAYELYPQGKLYRVLSYRQGIQSGPMLFWYPDGNPQMSANYRNGAPHGRFLGWYNNGSVIYNLVLNQGRWGADTLSDSDMDRLQTEDEITEREGTDND